MKNARAGARWTTSVPYCLRVSVRERLRLRPASRGGRSATLCRRYVVDGIDDRFISAKYAGRHRVAFMAGYVLSGSVDAVVRRINRYLSERGRAAERLGFCTVLAAAWARSSSHPRLAPPPIELHHAFLTFPAAP